MTWTRPEVTPSGLTPSSFVTEQPPEYEPRKLVKDRQGPSVPKLKSTVKKDGAGGKYNWGHMKDDEAMQAALRMEGDVDVDDDMEGVWNAATSTVSSTTTAASTLVSAPAAPTNPLEDNDDNFPDLGVRGLCAPQPSGAWGKK